MPTNDEEKVIVNGEEQKPIRKVAVPAEIDWQAVVLEKQRELDEEKAEK